MTTNTLECGFDWKEDWNASGGPPTEPDSPCTMSFGFASSGSARGRGQETDIVKTGQEFAFGLFDRSRAPDVSLDQVEINIERVKGQSRSPFNGFPGIFGNLGTGERMVVSIGLNSMATAWFTPSFLLQNTGTYRLTVNITASKNGQKRYWTIDPELQVGSGDTESRPKARREGAAS